MIIGVSQRSQVTLPAASLTAPLCRLLWSFADFGNKAALPNVTMRMRKKEIR